MRAKHLMLAAVIALQMPTVHGEAQEIGQPSRGLILAQRLCAECHAVQKNTRDPRTPMRLASRLLPPFPA